MTRSFLTRCFLHVSERLSIARCYHHWLPAPKSACVKLRAH